MSKKFISIVLALSLLISIMPLSATAEGEAGTEPEFIVENGVLLSYNGQTADVVIPSNLGIEAIGGKAFSGRYFLKSVVIPSGVTSIGNYAFSNCQSLVSVKLPDTVKEIGEYAFSYCYALLDINIPEGVKQINLCTFYYCRSLKEIKLPETLIKIDRYAFGYSGLTSVKIPNEVTMIEEGAFFASRALKDVTLSQNLIRVDKLAFNQTAIDRPLLICDNTVLIYVPDSYISYDIPDTVREIWSAFAYCYDIPSIVIPDTVKIIRDYAFYHCSSLTTLQIPDTTVCYGRYIFTGVGLDYPLIVNRGKTLAFLPLKLESYTIPNTVTEILEDAALGRQNLRSVTIPNSVTRIGTQAFWGCNRLQSVEIPDSVTYMGSLIFSQCTGLQYVKLSASAPSIRESTFYNCRSLTSLVVPEGVKEIESHAFFNCSRLYSVTLPESLKSVEAQAFNYCFNLDTVIVKGKDTVINERAFIHGTNVTILAYPSTATQRYAESFNKYSDISTPKTAVYSALPVLINGDRVDFEAYIIDGNTYFKLRDLAMALKDTQAKFEVTWIKEREAVSIEPQIDYTTVGGELLPVAAVSDKNTSLTFANISINGMPVSMRGYLIGQNNYFKLRDVAFFVDFGVGWDGAEKIVNINTYSSYSNS